MHNGREIVARRSVDLYTARQSVQVEGTWSARSSLCGGCEGRVRVMYDKAQKGERGESTVLSLSPGSDTRLYGNSVGLYAALSVAFRSGCQAKGSCLHVELVVWSSSMQSAALPLATTRRVSSSKRAVVGRNRYRLSSYSVVYGLVASIRACTSSSVYKTESIRS